MDFPHALNFVVVGFHPALGYVSRVGDKNVEGSMVFYCLVDEVNNSTFVRYI